MQKSIFFITSLLLINCLYAQKSTLKTSPMLGYVDFREACVWVQTTGNASVQVKYWKQKDTIFTTQPVQTDMAGNYTAKLLLNNIEPGNSYTYEVLIDNKPMIPHKTYTLKVPALWRWRTDPPTVRFAAGSCHYANETIYDRPGTPYGDTLPGIFNSIVTKQPDFMLWLGDNVYLREPDWHSLTGIYKRYDHSRSNPELLNLLSTCPNYAIWDDHDFGPNNSDRGFWNKEATLKVFKDYWANPGFGINGQPGITTFFNNGDADFFLMDDRYYRTPEGTPDEEGEMLGSSQLQWLKDNLLGSGAKFKFVVVGSQFLNTARVGENFMDCPKEREAIINHIYKHKIKNVIFLTGDRHHSEVNVLKKDSLPTIYDFTISPLTSGTGNWGVKEANTLRIEGSLITGKRNFAMIELTGARTSRKLAIIFYGREGEELNRFEFVAE